MTVGHVGQENETALAGDEWGPPSESRRTPRSLGAVILQGNRGPLSRPGPVDNSAVPVDETPALPRSSTVRSALARSPTPAPSLLRSTRLRDEREGGTLGPLEPSRSDETHTNRHRPPRSDVSSLPAGGGVTGETPSPESGDSTRSDLGRPPRRVARAG